MIEAHAFCCDSIEIWGVVYAGSVAADCFGGMVVRHDEDDVGRHCVVFRCDTCVSNAEMST
jgi:hypothetical protein